MKKLCAAVFLLLVGIVVAAVWFSPLARFDALYEYRDNEPTAALDGACYRSDALVRADFGGDANDMFRALERIGATVVKTAYAGDVTIAYAYSPRVACESERLSDGTEYNVMAAYSDGRIAIGAPVLSGCY